MNILIGCDPELFVTKDGKPVSAHGIIAGNKKEPHKVKKGAVQVDGMALEFNIDPADTYRRFSGNIDAVLSQLRSMVPEDLQFQITPVAYFDEDYIKQQPSEATELGCEPDYNAWTGKVNPTPDASVSFRTASGHIHIGWTEGMDIRDPDHIEACEMLVKQLDVVLGSMSLMWDKDDKRRELYGKLGAYRPKPYGVEYRVLSNAWLNNKLYRKIVWGAVRYCFDSLMNGSRLYEYNPDVVYRFARFGKVVSDTNLLRRIVEIYLFNMKVESYITPTDYKLFKQLVSKTCKEAGMLVNPPEWGAVGQFGDKPDLVNIIADLDGV